MRPLTIYVAGHTGLIGYAALRRFGADDRYRVVTAKHRELELRDDASAVQRFFADASPDYVILAAGKVGGFMEDNKFPADFINDNLAIQLNVLDAARRVGVQKLFFSSHHLACLPANVPNQ